MNPLGTWLVKFLFHFIKISSLPLLSPPHDVLPCAMLPPPYAVLPHVVLPPPHADFPLSVPHFPSCLDIPSCKLPTPVPHPPSCHVAPSMRPAPPFCWDGASMPVHFFHHGPPSMCKHPFDPSPCGFVSLCFMVFHDADQCMGVDYMREVLDQMAKCVPRDK